MKGFAGIKSAGNKTMRQQVKVMRLSALSLAIAAICSMPVYAADSSDGAPPKTSESGSAPAQANESLLDTLVITATKSSDPHTKTELGKLTEETPVAGSVLTRKIIDEVQYVDALRELSGMVPGLSIVRNMRIPDGGKSYTDMRINGLRVAYNMNMSLVDQANMTNVDHIDFINGPGTAINSSYTVGGTINVITRDPPKSLEAKVSQEAGSFGLNRTQANVGNTLSNGAGFTLSASNMAYAGSRANSSDQQKKGGVGGEFLIRPTDNSKLILSLDTLHFDYRLAGALNPGQFNSDWQQAGVYGRSDTNYTTDSARYQLLFGDRAELNLAASQRTTATTGYGNTGSGQTPLTAVATIAKSNEVDNAYQAVFRKEFDLAQSTFNAGVEIADFNLDSVTYNNSFTAAQGQLGDWGLGSVNSKGSDSIEHDKTPFFLYEFSPLDKVRFNLGERSDRIDDSINNRATPSISLAGKTFDKNVFKGGVTFDYAPDQMVWGNLSQGFLAPALAALSGSGSVTTVPAPNLQPENDLTQEIGFRGKSEANRLRYDVTFYHSTVQNIAVTRNLTTSEATYYSALYGFAYTAAGSSINENAGSLTARGVETQLSWNVTQKLELASTYTWGEAYFNNYITGTGATRINQSGHSYADMPTNHLNLRLAYLPVAGARVQLDGDYISKYYIDTANSGTYKRPNIFNLRSSYAVDKNWTASLNMLNLGNVKYAEHVGDTTNGNPSTIYFNTLGNSGSYEPLSVRIGLSYKFK